METFPTPADLTLTFSSYGRILINANIAREESALTFKAYGHPFPPIMDHWVGGGIPTDLGVVLLGVGTENNPFWVKNMGSDPPYGKTLGGGSTTRWQNISRRKSPDNETMGVGITHR